MADPTRDPTDIDNHNVSSDSENNDRVGGEMSSLSSGESHGGFGGNGGDGGGGVVNIDWNNPELQRMNRVQRETFDSLRRQIQGLQEKEKVTNARLERLQDAYSKRKKGGKKALLKDLEGIDSENVQKITEFVDTFLVTREFILMDGWDRWSENSKSFCQICISKCGIVAPHNYKTMEQYWDTFASVMIGRLLGRKRDALVQRIRARWTSE